MKTKQIVGVKHMGLRTKAAISWSVGGRVCAVIAGFLLLFVVAACGGGGGAPGGADAESYPERNITWIVPFEAGGGTDTYARQIAPVLGDELGVNVEVRNVPGAGGLIGIRQVAEEEPDGYTITNFNPPSSTIAQIAEGEDAGVDLRNLDHIGGIGSTTYVVFARNDFPADDLQSAIEVYNNGDATVLSGQEVGGPVELLALLMKQRYDWGWEEYVGYEGGGEVTAAVLRNEAPVGIASDTAVQTGVEAGDFKVLAVLQNTETPVLPDAQTAVAQGYPDLDVVSRLTRVVAGPPDMPQEIRGKLTNALEAAVKADRTQEWARETGNPVDWFGPEAARKATVESFRVEEEVPEDMLEEISE